MILMIMNDQVEMAFQIGAAVTGDVSQGLSWRPLPMDKATGMGGFMAQATEPDSPEAQGLFAYLREVGKEGGLLLLLALGLSHG